MQERKKQPAMLPCFEAPMRRRPMSHHLHTAGQRSARLAARIAALPTEVRTPLQERLLRQHEQGECIGCTRQGFPLESTGNEVPFRYEPDGFASPLDYCDCPKGQHYRRRVEQRRRQYAQERVQDHQRALRALFGAACARPAVMTEWTIEHWPVVLPLPEEWLPAERELVRATRQNVQVCLQHYARHLTIWDEMGYKQGIALFGAPGVGKSGLVRCLEPHVLTQGYSMVCLHVPDLVVALESHQVEQMLSAILATDVVLLDNLGFLVSLGYKETQGRLALLRLINALWERQRKILLTSNATEAQLVEQLGEETVSRLHALCRFFEVPGIDLRQGRS